MDHLTLDRKEVAVPDSTRPWTTGYSSVSRLNTDNGTLKENGLLGNYVVKYLGVKGHDGGNLLSNGSEKHYAYIKN